MVSQPERSQQHHPGHGVGQVGAESSGENTRRNQMSESTDDPQVIEAVVEPVFDNNQGSQGHRSPVLVMTCSDTPTNANRSMSFQSRKFKIFLISLLTLGALGVVSACFTVGLRDDGSPSRVPTPGDNEAMGPELDYEDRLAQAMDFLIESGVLNPTSFVKTTDPRYRALDWSVYEDLTWTSLVEPKSRDRFLRRYVLILLAYSTDIDRWNRPTIWTEMAQAHECTFDGIRCDDDDRIAGLWMPRWDLSGTIPEELGLVLTDLTHVSLSANNLEGSIPESLYDLNLQYLDLQWNELSSTISSKIGQLTDLKHFTVGKNRLTGTFPIESLQQLTKMEIFVVSANRLEGRIFDAVMSWPRLQDLQLSALPLVDGTIPTTIGQLSRMVSLFLEGFDPVVPTEIGLLTNLEIFHFSNPRPAIEGLDLNKTAILPTEIGKLTALSDLLFQSNSFSAGAIPTELGYLTNLQYMRLSNNAFTGPLPSTLGNLSNLNVASFADCTELTGTVPQEFGNFAHSLSLLQLYRTQLEGTLPQEFCDAPLAEIYLDCQFLTCPCCTRLFCGGS